MTAYDVTYIPSGHSVTDERREVCDTGDTDRDVQELLDKYEEWNAEVIAIERTSDRKRLYSGYGID